jgi:hypothetical protein
MENVSVEVLALLSVLFVLATQWAKSVWPETFEKYRKYVTWFLMASGGALNVTWYLGSSAPFPVGTTDLSIVQGILTAVIFGAGAGLSATGLYVGGNNLDPANIKSVATILAEKRGSFARTEVQVQEVKPVEPPKVVETTTTELEVTVVADEVTETPKKIRKSNKKGN